MIESLVGNSTAEKVLLYIANYGEGHISGIADTFGISKSQVRKQILRLEKGGILVARFAGNSKMFQINPRYSFKKELLTLLEKALGLLSSKEIEKYYRQRRRPRRTGKEL
ncbi:MAG: winged helix-turn-helix domain-containing protein [Bdellovibrionota bacterium]